MRSFIFPCLVWLALASVVNVSKSDASSSDNAPVKEEQRNILFVLHKGGVKKVDIVGDFSTDKEPIIFPMSLSAKKKWSASLKLKPEFYSYRYLLDKKHWRLDPNNKKIIKTSVGKFEGRFSLLEVYPKKYASHIKMADRFFENDKDRWGIKVLIKTIKKFPEKIGTYEKLGEIYERYDLLGFAFDAYIAGLEKNPGAHRLRYLLATCYGTAFKNTKNKKYKRAANVQWSILREVEEYKYLAQKHLLNKY